MQTSLSDLFLLVLGEPEFLKKTSDNPEIVAGNRGTGTAR